MILLDTKYKSLTVVLFLNYAKNIDFTFLFLRNKIFTIEITLINENIIIDLDMS